MPALRLIETVVPAASAPAASASAATAIRAATGRLGMRSPPRSMSWDRVDARERPVEHVARARGAVERHRRGRRWAAVERALEPVVQQVEVADDLRDAPLL